MHDTHSSSSSSHSSWLDDIQTDGDRDNDPGAVAAAAAPDQGSVVNYTLSSIYTLYDSEDRGVSACNQLL